MYFGEKISFYFAWKVLIKIIELYNLFFYIYCDSRSNSSSLHDLPIELLQQLSNFLGDLYESMAEHATRVLEEKNKRDQHSLGVVRYNG